jgi:hypothetical protein
VSSWIDEIAVGTKREHSALHASPSGISVGNLAALEEDPLPDSAPVSSVPLVPAQSSSSPVGAPVLPSATSSAKLPPDPKPVAATKVGVAVALLVVVAAGAAAWFTHLIPHQ